MERAPRSLDKSTLIPIGAALALAYGVFLAGGVYSEFKSIQNFDVPKKLDDIRSEMTGFKLDLALIKGRLGITGADHRAGIGPTFEGARTTPPPRVPLPAPPRHTVEFGQ